MTTRKLRLTGHLARAARALVGTSSSVTAQAAGLTRSELRDFEKGRSSLSGRQKEALVDALEQLGAFFLPDGTTRRGHGVQLKFSKTHTAKVETWEGEGGLPADDDV